MDEENKVVSTQQEPTETNAPVQAAPQPVNKNMMVCKSCGAQIAKNAKTCPSCGAKNKKTGKKILIFAVVALVLIIIFAAAGGKDDANTDNTAAREQAVQDADSGKKPAQKTTAAPEYVTVAIETLFDDLEGNAYNAQQKWKDQYVTITGGKVSTIDASGEYFSIESSSDEYWLSSILVNIPRDIRDEVMSSISEVGEIMGYTIDAYEVYY